MNANKPILAIGEIHAWLSEQEQDGGKPIPTGWYEALEVAQAVMTHGESIWKVLEASARLMERQ